MDAKDETLNLLNKIWVKLQGLPNANPIELGAFFILLTFICESLLSIIPTNLYSEPIMILFIFFSAVVVVLMTVLTCVACCCCRKTKTKGVGI